MISGRAAERHRAAGIQVRCHQKQLAAELPEIVSAVPGREQPPQESVDRALIEHAGRDRAAQRGVRLQRAAAPWMAQVDSGGLGSSRGTDSARRKNSRSAGRRKSDGESPAAAPSSMNSLYIWGGEMP